MAVDIAEATKDNFRELVAEGTVMVDLWGTSCTVCLALMPQVERLAEEHPEMRVVKLEAPKARRLCMELKVLGLPAFLMFQDGQEVSRLGGQDLSAEELEQWVDKNLSEVGKG